MPPVAPLTEDGVYLPGFGELSGKQAVLPETADWILAELAEKGLLFATEKYPHRYPHCWRCKTELLYRLVDEWFISMSWREEIMKICHDIRWIPERRPRPRAGLAQEHGRLDDLQEALLGPGAAHLGGRENRRVRGHRLAGGTEGASRRGLGSIRRQSAASARGSIWSRSAIRRPATCMSRIGDVGNPWLDAGIVPYSTLGYNTDRAYWKKWFPADFITECFPGQFRNWFYALLAMSTMMEQKAPFKVLLGPRPGAR